MPKETTLEQVKEFFSTIGKTLFGSGDDGNMTQTGGAQQIMQRATGHGNVQITILPARDNGNTTLLLVGGLLVIGGVIYWLKPSVPPAVDPVPAPHTHESPPEFPPEGQHQVTKLQPPLSPSPVSRHVEASGVDSIAVGGDVKGGISVTRTAKRPSEEKPARESFDHPARRKAPRTKVHTEVLATGRNAIAIGGGVDGGIKIGESLDFFDTQVPTENHQAEAEDVFTQLQALREEMQQQFSHMQTIINDCFISQEQKLKNQMEQLFLSSQEQIKTLILETIWGKASSKSSKHPSFIAFQQELFEAFQAQLALQAQTYHASLAEHFSTLPDSFKALQESQTETLKSDLITTLNQFNQMLIDQQSKLLSEQINDLQAQLTRYQEDLQKYFEEESADEEEESEIISAIQEILDTVTAESEGDGKEKENDDFLTKVSRMLQSREKADDEKIQSAEQKTGRGRDVSALEEFMKDSLSKVDKQPRQLAENLIEHLKEMGEDSSFARVATLIAPALKVATAANLAEGESDEESRELSAEEEFGHKLYRALTNTVELYRSIVDGKITGSSLGQQGGQAIQIAGQLIPLPYAALVCSLLGKGVQYADKNRLKKRAKKFLTFLGEDEASLKGILETASTRLASDYREQLNRLDAESVEVSIQVVLSTYIQAALKAAKQEQEMSVQEKIETLLLSVRAASQVDLKKQSLQILLPATHQEKHHTWNTVGMFRRSGVIVRQANGKAKEGDGGVKYILPPTAGRHVLEIKDRDEHDRYGFHYGTLFEVNRAKMIKAPEAQPLMPMIPKFG